MIEASSLLLGGYSVFKKFLCVLNIIIYLFITCMLFNFLMFRLYKYLYCNHYSIIAHWTVGGNSLGQEMGIRLEQSSWLIIASLTIQ